MTTTPRPIILLAGMLFLIFCARASFAADVANGSKLYAVHCIACHGASGVNVMTDAPNFTKGEGLLTPDPALLLSIKNGKNAMPAYRGILTDTEVFDVIAYLRTLF